MQKSILVFAVMLWLVNVALAQTGQPLELSVTTTPNPTFILTDPKEVLKHEGEFVTVEGCVASAVLKEDLNGKPLFIVYSSYIIHHT